MIAPDTVRVLDEALPARAFRRSLSPNVPWRATWTTPSATWEAQETVSVRGPFSWTLHLDNDQGISLTLRAPGDDVQVHLVTFLRAVGALDPE